MYARHIFSILTVILFTNNQIEAPSTSTSGVKLQRTGAFKAETRDFEVQRRRLSSSSSASSASVYSRTAERGERQSLTAVDLRPSRIDLKEASTTTFSGGNIDPAQHGVYARIRNAVLRHAATFTGGIGVGVGVSVINNFTHKNIVGDAVSTTNNFTYNNISSVQQQEVENPL